MASRIARLFFNVDAIREANQIYRDRMAEIHEQEREFNEALATAKQNNKAAFHAQIAANTAKRKAKLAKIGSR